MENKLQKVQTFLSKLEGANAQQEISPLTTELAHSLTTAKYHGLMSD